MLHFRIIVILRDMAESIFDVGILASAFVKGNNISLQSFSWRLYIIYVYIFLFWLKADSLRLLIKGYNNWFFKIF